MWTYDKVLEYPINIRETNTELAKNIISQYGGPDGELAASLRYLSQKFSMPDQKAKAILNDIGTEEWAPKCYHLICLLLSNINYWQQNGAYSTEPFCYQAFKSSFKLI